MGEARDFLNSEFRYEEENYPGSKQKRRDQKVVEAVADPVEWDTHSYVKVINGVDTEVFSIEALCIGLDRPAVTIRLWMRKEYIPEAFYRMPARTVNGKKQKGRRLFTRGQVESLLNVFEKRGIRENVRVDWKKHHPDLCLEIAEAWLAQRKEV